MEKFRIYLSIVVAMLIWSFSYIWTKIAITVFPPMTLVTLRLVLSAILLLVYLKFSGKFQKLKKGDIKWFLLLALFEPYLYFVGETYGLTLVDATLASVIISTIPLFTPLVAYFWIKEKVGWRNMIGILISLSGVFLVVWVPGSGMNASPTGVMLMFFAVFAAPFYATMLKKLPEHYNVFTVVFYQNLFGLIYFIPTLLWVDGKKISGLQLTQEAVMSVFMLAAFASLAAFVLFAYVIRKIGVSKTSVFVNLMPVFTAIFAGWVLHDKILPLQWAGVIVAISGLFFSQFGETKTVEEKQEEMIRASEY